MADPFGQAISQGMAEAATGEATYPVDLLRRHLAEHLARLPDRDDRELLLRHVKAGPDYPVPWSASELTAGQCMTYARQILMAVGGQCEHLDPANGRVYACGSCMSCEAYPGRRKAAVDLIAAAFDAAEAEIAGHAPESEDQAGSWITKCAQCGSDYRTKSTLSRTCSSRCRQAQSKKQRKARAAAIT